MRLTDLLGPHAIVSPVIATTKKDALLELAQRAAELSGQPAREIYDAVLQRERLGSTGIGDGVAIPHGKLSNVSTIYGVFARAERPIDFDALDGAPVDLIFMLITPEKAGADHLKALACAARMLRDAPTVSALRRTRDSGALYELIAGRSQHEAA
jgi:PTS system nitrogen regulatory IIA component